MPRLERDFQPVFIKNLKRRFPGCVVQKLDTSYQQGIPDLLFLHGTFWGIMEVKKEEPTSASDFEENQEWFLELFGNMSFSACVYPSNEKEVLDAIQFELESRR